MHSIHSSCTELRKHVLFVLQNPRKFWNFDKKHRHPASDPLQTVGDGTAVCLMLLVGFCVPRAACVFRRFGGMRAVNRLSFPPSDCANCVWLFSSLLYALKKLLWVCAPSLWSVVGTIFETCSRRSRFCTCIFIDFLEACFQGTILYSKTVGPPILGLFLTVTSLL